MSEDALRLRLEALNRGPLAPGAPFRRSHKTTGATKLRSQPCDQRDSAGQRSAMPLAGLLRRGEAVETPDGEHWRVVLPLDQLWNGGTGLVNARQAHLQLLREAAAQAVEPSVVMRPDFASFVAALPDRALVLDVESCGLAGAAVFLVGLLRWMDGAPAVELLLARNYAEERAVLESLWQLVATHDVLVTFNGKTFDWPMILDRSARHRFDRRVTAKRLAHLDVLHYARRRWRRQLPDCRLQTLERLVCLRRRGGDVAGNRIPAIYAEFVRTGWEREMDAVLYHNALDLVTLYDLALRLAV
jgi:uncharacterized protein YprB with RNaseH-like and TPR domain